jgi:hypothetical protein
MKVTFRTRLLIAVALFVLGQSAGDRLHADSMSEPKAPRRIAFSVSAIEQRGTSRNVLSEAVIEGPEGTDFNVKLTSGRFRMKASFLTDMIDNNLLRVRADLETRRFYGYSQSQLPLYEEDQQNQSFTLGFDEQMVVLPFGQKDGDDQLRIEITPAPGLEPEKGRKLDISILKETLKGAINVEAFKRPHRFDVDAALLEDGRQIGHASSPALLAENRQLMIADPNSPNSSGRGALAVSLAVDGYIRNRSEDEASISFDVNLVDEEHRIREAIAKNYAGICTLGRPVTYDLTANYHGTPGHKYELRLTVNLAPGESPD